MTQAVYESPSTLVAILVAARRAGDRELERVTRRELEERYQIRVTFAAGRPQMQEAVDYNELQELRRDALRWRIIKRAAWGRERANGLWGPIMKFDVRLPAVEVDGDACTALIASVDAAMKATKEPDSG